MKTTGTVKTVDKNGRFVLPKGVRRKLGVEQDGQLEILLEGDTAILKGYAPGCAFCGTTESVAAFQNKFICPHCLDEALKLREAQKVDNP